MENVWKRDIRSHNKREGEAMYYHKAGSLSVSCNTAEKSFNIWGTLKMATVKSV